MKVGPYESGTPHKAFVHSRADIIKMDTRCLFAGKLDCPLGWQQKPHAHPFCEIMFVLTGYGTVEMGEKSYPVKEGDIIVYNPGATHSEHTRAEGGIKFAFFGISNFKIGELPTDFLVEENASVVLHTEGDKEKFDFFFRSLLEEISIDQPYNELMVKYWARLILIGILRLSNVSEAKFVTNAIFTRIHDYLNQHFAEISCMADICEKLNISKYYLSHVFKKYMGTPPMQYVTLRRISHAKRLLRETDLPASAISEACGYEDRVLFFKAFRKMEGMTPGEFRRHERGERLPDATEKNEIQP